MLPVLAEGEQLGGQHEAVAFEANEEVDKEGVQGKPWNGCRPGFSDHFNANIHARRTKVVPQENVLVFKPQVRSSIFKAQAPLGPRERGESVLGTPRRDAPPALSGRAAGLT